jgi:hypothetical protein
MVNWIIERSSYVIPNTGIEILPGNKIPFLLLAPNSEPKAYWSLYLAKMDAEKLCVELDGKSRPTTKREER